MSTNKVVAGVSAGLIILIGIIVIGFREKQKRISAKYTTAITIEQTWKLPRILREVSGIAFMDNDRIACIQDEQGQIFIFNLETSEIEKDIPFAGGGDYEGITLAGTTAFVLKSDGTIYEVRNFMSDPEVMEHETPLSRQHDVEGLYHNAENKRLLLAIKAKEPETDEYKGVYAVNLENMKMEEDPVFKLFFNDPVFDKVEARLSNNKFRPSEINIHPRTGEIYMLSAEVPKLLIFDSEGNPRELHFLNRSNFPNPEGLTFDTSGSIYISNEGNPANIHKISLN